NPQPSTLNSRLIRPLLFASRDEILEYSRIHKITWREDSSNASDDYSRNFVRHHIVPLMEDLNPNFLNTAARSMGRIGEAEDNLTFLLNNWLNGEGLTSTLSIEKQKLAQLPAPQQALRQLLKPFGFDAEQSRQLAENLDHVGLELHSEKGFTALVDRTEILVSSPSNPPCLPAGRQSTNLPITSPPIAIHEDDLMVSLPDGSRLFFLPSFALRATAGKPVTDHQSATVDAEKMKFPLHLRHWLPGDSFQPLGMGGKSQKLQDFFTNQKLSRFEKEKVWLLLDGNDAVVWVLGLRLDERFKIQSKTNKALKINWIK
ncbi:MAG: tRNA lysidine(34) synthetase TilS, partial [Phycisphaerae bacterium]|nr:tRNA lysidine(34) synthetase TilS [Saprospiraceae bacterium]